MESINYGAHVPFDGSYINSQMMSQTVADDFEVDTTTRLTNYPSLTKFMNTLAIFIKPLGYSLNILKFLVKFSSVKEFTRKTGEKFAVFNYDLIDVLSPTNESLIGLDCIKFCKGFNLSETRHNQVYSKAGPPPFVLHSVQVAGETRDKISFYTFHFSKLSLKSDATYLDKKCNERLTAIAEATSVVQDDDMAFNFAPKRSPKSSNTENK